MNKLLIPKRYYLHGDVSEINHNKYYCALCDTFKQKEHFYSDKFHKVNNQENYSAALQRFKNASKTFLKYNIRPSKVANLFSDIPKKKFGKFYRWLKKQKERDDPIGDLANDALTMILWVRLFLQAQGYTVTDNVIFQDNQSTMLLTKNGRQSSGKKM